MKHLDGTFIDSKKLFLLGYNSSMPNGIEND